MSSYYKLNPDLYKDNAKIIAFNGIKKMVSEKDNISLMDMKFLLTSVIKNSISGPGEDPERFVWMSLDPRDSGKNSYQVCFCLDCGEYINEYMYTEDAPSKIKCDC